MWTGKFLNLERKSCRFKYLYMLIIPEKMSHENNNYLLQCECQEHVRLELKTVFWEMITLNGNCSFQLIMK